MSIRRADKCPACGEPLAPTATTAKCPECAFEYDANTLIFEADTVSLTPNAIAKLVLVIGLALFAAWDFWRAKTTGDWSRDRGLGIGLALAIAALVAYSLYLRQTRPHFVAVTNRGIDLQTGNVHTVVPWREVVSVDRHGATATLHTSRHDRGLLLAPALGKRSDVDAFIETVRAVTPI
ncbi:MAG: hypothetical protein KDA32_04755 [Phycisphaerales bacterium]|nr:hypothetical protein [Phycisphaerales bacterium]